MPTCCNVAGGSFGCYGAPMLPLMLLLACASGPVDSGPAEGDTDTDTDTDTDRAVDSDPDSDSDSDSDTGPDLSFRLEVGYHDVDVTTGQPTTFNLLVPPARRTMEHGPQGGWHVEASARLYNSGPQAFIDYEIRDAVTQELLSAQNYAVALINYSGTPAAGTAVGDYANMTGFLDDLGALNDPDKDPPEVMHHRTVDIIISATDVPDGNQATATLTDVTLYCDQDPINDCDSYALPLPW
jgi:hypothetical protein